MRACSALMAAFLAADLAPLGGELRPVDFVAGGAVGTDQNHEVLITNRPKNRFNADAPASDGKG